MAAWRGWRLAVSLSVVAVLALVLIAVLLRTGSSGTGPITASGHALKIDEVRGRYGPIRIGDSKARVEKLLGKAPRWRAAANSVGPLGAKGSEISAASSRCRLPGQRLYVHDEFLRYEAVSMWAAGGRVCDFIVTAPDAVTSRGVGIGDEMDKAKTKYPHLHCGTANEGTEYATYPFCTGRLQSGIYIWFGGDPINDLEYGHSRYYQ